MDFLTIHSDAQIFLQSLHCNDDSPIKTSACKSLYQDRKGYTEYM